MLFGTPMNSTNWIYISLGRTGRMFQRGLMSTPVYILAFVIGLPYGGAGVAVAYSVAVAVLFIPCFMMATHNTPLKLTDVLTVIWPISSIAVVIGVLLRFATDGASTLMGVAMTAAGGIAYLVLAAALVLTVPAYASTRRYGMMALDKGLARVRGPGKADQA